MDNIEKYNMCDFANAMKDRSHGVTEEDFYKDVEIWETAIKSLPRYNEDVFHEDIKNMDLQIPIKKSDYDTLCVFYSNLVSYRVRIAEIMYVVNAHCNFFEKAYKSLKSASAVLYSGTVKDKEANSESMVQPLLLGYLSTKNFLDYVLEVKENIDFASMNTARILREKEVESRINSGWNNNGSNRQLEDSF